MGGSIRQTLPSPRPVRQICLATLTVQVGGWVAVGARSMGAALAQVVERRCKRIPPRSGRRVALRTLGDTTSCASGHGSRIGGPKGRCPQRRDARPIARTLSAMRVLGTWSEGPSPRFRGGRSPEGSVAFLDRSRVGCRRACPARRRRASRVLAVRAGPLPGAGEFAGGQAGEQ